MCIYFRIGLLLEMAGDARVPMRRFPCLIEASILPDPQSATTAALADIGLFPLEFH